MSATRAASRHPPAFRIDIAPQPRLQGLVSLVAVLSMASLVAGLALHLPLAGWSALVLLPAAALVGWRMARVAPGALRWDGQCWQLGTPAVEVAVELEVLFDLGDWLLLRAQVPGGRQRHYLPLSQARSGPAWGSLRATLYSARSVRTRV